MNLLTADHALEHLRRRGIVGPHESARASMLSGGVSSTTILVENDRGRYVVKQPLPRLAVRDDWQVPVHRAAVETAALKRCSRLTREHVPTVVDFDPETYVITMEAAPSTWREWRRLLLDGTVDPAAGATLGRLLAHWHLGTRGDVEVLREFGDLGLFLDLRGDPFHRTVAERRPDLAGPVLECLRELTTRQRCLVHGDFSPKNVLVAPDGAVHGVWVLDLEVAHAGNPVFDLAFMLHHLVAKTVHRPQAAPAIAECAYAFVRTYTATLRVGGSPGADDEIDESTIVRHTGALLLARVIGKSPAPYLRAAERESVLRLGEVAVCGRVTGLDDLLGRSDPR